MVVLATSVFADELVAVIKLSVGFEFVVDADIIPKVALTDGIELGAEGK